MGLIQPLKFRTLKTGCFKMLHLQMPRLQMAVFQMGLQLPLGKVCFGWKCTDRWKDRHAG